MAQEVAGPLVHLLAAVRRRAGLLTEGMFQGLRFREEDLGNPRARIDWEDFTILLDRTLAEIGSEAAFEDAMAETARLLIPAQLCEGIFPDLQTFYVWMGSIAASRLHTNLQVSARVEADGRVLMEHHIPRPYRPSRALAIASAGTFRGAVRVLGLPDAQVECSFDERSGLFRVTPPPCPRHARRRVRSSGAGPRPQSLFGPNELERTRALMRQGAGFLKAASLGELLARLEESLRGSAGCEAGGLWLRRPGGRMEAVHAWGDGLEARSTRMLISGGRILGRFDFSGPGDPEGPESEALEELMAWACAALDPWLEGRVVGAGPPPRRLDLTARERQVLALLLQGRSDKQIAQAFGTSPRTVSHQVGLLLHKSGAENRTALTRLCLAGRRA